jgi:hypothetical protein
MGFLLDRRGMIFRQVFAQASCAKFSSPFRSALYHRIEKSANGRTARATFDHPLSLK